MRKFLVILMCFGAILAADDEALVKQRLTDFTSVLNKGKAEEISPFISEDATFIVPTTGEEIDGRDAIVDHLVKKVQEMNGQAFSFKITKVTFPKPDEAVAQGVVQVTDNKGQLKDRRARQLELVKQGNNWIIQASREIPVAEAPDIYEHLKELGWLVGDWKDEDEDVSIKFSVKWDKYRNFLIQHFETSIYGLEELEGRQIIGWDPIEKKIRSWVFDSDGGFGSGTWTNSGDTWRVAMKYTLSDGRVASSVSIYKKTDDKHYEFSSVERDVGGVILPNIEPVTVVKEE